MTKLVVTARSNPHSDVEWYILAAATIADVMTAVNGVP